MATRRQPDRRFPNRRPRGPHPSPAPTPTRVLAVRSADAPTRTAAMRCGATADARRAAINRATAASGDPSWHCKQSSFLSSASGELVERGASRRRRRMGRGRGVSYGGGQSSLSYLFGGGGDDEPAAAPAKPAAAVEQRAQQPVATAAAAAPASADGEKQKGIPAGVRGSQTNNYFRAQGQNCGNFLTDRPSTKVHAAPGGGSSLGYLFGGGAPGSK